MKDALKKVDWVQIGVLGLGLVATLAKGLYENKRFDSDLEKRFNNRLEQKVEEIVEAKLKNMK